MGHVLDRLAGLSDDLGRLAQARDDRDLARARDDRHLAGLATAAIGTVADLHTIGEMLASVAGVPDTAGEVGR